jgi:hypothetical protein
MASVMRDKVDAGEKQQRIRVYRQADELIFPASSRLWEIHYAAAKCRFWEGKNWTIRALRAAVEERLGRRIPQWLFGRNPLREHEWFFPWFLRGKLPPKNVRVIPEEAVVAARAWWDYPRLCRLARPSVTNGMYVKWLRMLPSVEWLKWLYGAPPPPGSFVVSAALQKLRTELGEMPICAAGHVSRKTVDEWRADPGASAALDAARNAASKGGHAGGLVKIAAWNQQTEVVQKAMWRYGKAATITAASMRAGIEPTVYTSALREADRLGVRKELEKYVATRGRGKEHRQSGLVASKFFIPSAGMLAFRTAAVAELVEHSAVKNLARYLEFDEWFTDWTTPRAMRGRRRELTKVGMLPAMNEAARVTTEEKGTTRPKSLTLAVAERISGLARSSILYAVRDGRIASNGAIGRDLRIDKTSFVDWLEERSCQLERRESAECVQRKMDRATAH